MMNNKVFLLAQKIAFQNKQYVTVGKTKSIKVSSLNSETTINIELSIQRL